MKRKDDRADRQSHRCLQEQRDRYDTISQTFSDKKKKKNVAADVNTFINSLIFRKYRECLTVVFQLVKSLHITHISNFSEHKIQISVKLDTNCEIPAKRKRGRTCERRSRAYYLQSVGSNQ